MESQLRSLALSIPRLLRIEFHSQLRLQPSCCCHFQPLLLTHLRRHPSCFGRQHLGNERMLGLLMLLLRQVRDLTQELGAEIDEPISPERQFGRRRHPNELRVLGNGEDLGRTEPVRLPSGHALRARGHGSNGFGEVAVCLFIFCVLEFESCDFGLAARWFVSFPVGFLAGSIAVTDGFVGAAKFEWMAVAACGVAGGARVGSHDVEVVWTWWVVDNGGDRNGFGVLDGQLKSGLVVSCASAAFCGLATA